MVRRFLLFALLAIPAARADDWPAARRVEIFSTNGERFVRILPGDSFGDVQGFAGAAKGRYARAEHYERGPDRSFQLAATFGLPHPIAPADAMLSDAGRLITFDNWHNAGYGKVVAVHAPDGELLAAYALEDLYAAEDLAKVPSSVSSRWWRCKPQGWSDPAAQSLVFVHEFRGGYFVFNLTNGERRYDSGASPCVP